MSHTPGPWLISGGTFVYALVPNPDRGSVRRGHPAEINKFSCPINGDYRLGTNEEFEANARLIAAAPDLLSALVEAEFIVKSAATKEKIADSLDTTARHAYAAIQAAIKKARGE